MSALLPPVSGICLSYLVEMRNPLTLSLYVIALCHIAASLQIYSSHSSKIQLFALKFEEEDEEANSLSNLSKKKEERNEKKKWKKKKLKNSMHPPLFLWYWKTEIYLLFPQSKRVGYSDWILGISQIWNMNDPNQLRLTLNFFLTYYWYISFWERQLKSRYVI